MNTASGGRGYLLRIGDRVRFRDAHLGAIGTVVEEVTEHHLRVQWDEVPHASIHHRMSLERSMYYPDSPLCSGHK